MHRTQLLVPETPAQRPRAHSHDAAAPAALSNSSFFSLLTATAKSKYNDEALGGDETLGEDTLGEDTLDQDTLDEEVLKEVLGGQVFDESDEDVPDDQVQIRIETDQDVQQDQEQQDSHEDNDGIQDATLKHGKESTRSYQTTAETDPQPTKVDTKKTVLARFGLDEAVLHEQTCWLLKNILLQGRLYVTARHLCFFAYLPRRRSKALKSGSLSKRARRAPRFQRFWFVLEEDSLSYYASAVDTYFPSGRIDLRYATSAQAVADSTFSLVTETRTFTFRADSPSHAKEWVNSLHRAIFRAKNQGDDVRIVIPLENVIDMDQRSIFEVGHTIIVRAVDSDQTYSIDDYVFAFFEAPAALTVIENQLKQLSIELEPGNRSGVSRAISESVKDSTANLRVPSLPDAGAAPSTGPSGSSNSVKSQTSWFWPGSAGSGSGSGSGLASSPGSPSVSAAASVIDLDTESERGRSMTLTSTRLRTLSLGKRALSPLLPIKGLAEKVWPGDDKSSPLSVRRYYPTSVVNKVSEMWEGGLKHFSAADGTASKSEEEQNIRFRAHFSLPDSDHLVATYFCHLQRAIPLYGKLYLSNRHVCFRTLIPGTKTKMILPLSDVENVTKERGFRFGYSGLVLVIHGHEEVFFEFSYDRNRDDCEVMVLKGIAQAVSQTGSSQSHSQEGLTRVATSGTLTTVATTDSFSLSHARLYTYEDALQTQDGLSSLPAVVLDEHALHSGPGVSLAAPKNKLKFTLLTIGSRGDVQPYISLAKGLLKEGHRVTIATHVEFQPWIEKHGIGFSPIAGDPAQLMKIMVDHGMLSVAFLREAAARFRTWITELLETSWTACQGTDVLIESPSAMGGIHIAEALQIPYFRAFTMPWTRTRAYPHAFIVPEQKMGGSYNYLTYVLFDNVFWKGISGQVNKWRQKTLHLPATSLDQLQVAKVPFLYNVSPAVFVPPVDFPDWTTVTGYWFLDEGTAKDFEPPEDLAAFIKSARDDDMKLVYIGFGSIVVSDPYALTKAVVNAVLKANVRCILSKGWSERLKEKGKSPEPETPLPPQILLVKSVPHDWLFPQLDAAVHHGGSGTTGASLRAGLPTIVKPFFGDQFFYAGRVEDLGAGIHLKKLTVSQLSKALWEVTHNDRIIAKARAIGSAIRSEHGVKRAIEVIYRDLGYAKAMSKGRARRSSTGEHDEGEAGSDESWTMLDEDD